MDWLTNWLLLTEIIPHFGTPLELVSDNGPENVNEIMRQTVESLNIKHIVTSPYHLQRSLGGSK